jgi:hypothetical protein
MIIKVPIYLSLEGKFSPDEAKEANFEAQKTFFKFLKANVKDNAIYTFASGRKAKISIVSSDVAKKQVVKPSIAPKEATYNPYD